MDDLGRKECVKPSLQSLVVQPNPRSQAEASDCEALTLASLAMK